MGVTSTWTPHKLVALLLLSINPTLINCSYINADKVLELTERTLGKGNEFDIELSFTNLDGKTPCQNCTVCTIQTGVHALYDNNPRTQLCTKCDVPETCPSDYLIHADLTFDNRWPMNYYKLTSSQNGGKDPEEVWLKGSRNNGRTWFDLDHQSGLSFTDRKQDKILTFKNKLYFTKYRLTMRKGNEENSSNSMELSGYQFASDFLSKFVTDLIYNVVKIQFFQPDIITLYNNFRVGEITEPAKNYEISFVVHPFEASSSNHAMLRFTSIPSRNSGYYGTRVPFIELVKNNDSVDKNNGLGVRVWMDSNRNVGQWRNAKKTLQLNKNNKMKFVVLGDKVTLFIENEIAATFVIPENERPNFSRLYAYASDPFYTCANAQLKHLVYTPIDVEAESTATKFKPTSMKVIKNVKIATIVEPHNNFELSFRFNPSSTDRSVTSILRLTTDSTGSLNTEAGHRIPLIGLFPDSYNLLWNYGLTESNRHWQYPAVLVPKIDNVIKIKVLDDAMSLFINGIYSGSLPYPLINRPLYDRIYVFASDNILKAADGTLSHVQYKPIHTNTQTTRFPTVSRIGARSYYNRIGYFDQMPTSEYIISATLYTWGKTTSNGYSIFRFSSVSNGHNDKTPYGTRSPMLHYKSNNDPRLGLSFVSKTESGGTKYQEIGFKNELNQYEETHVTIVSMDNKISFYVNGQLVDSTTAPLIERPPFKRMYVFTSTSYQPFFYGMLKQLEYTPLYKSNQIIFQPTGRNLRLSPGRFVGTVTNPRLTNLYEITFTIRPYSTYSDWTSILRFTRPNGEDTSKYGDRAPALWFLPSSRRIHLSHGSTEDPTRYFQTEAALSYNRDSNIRIITREDGIITMYVNDQPAGSMYVPLATRPPIDTLNVYLSDAFYRWAYADIYHLTYRHIYHNAGNEFLLSRGLKSKRDNVIGEISYPTSDFVISAIIHPVGTFSRWSNVFRFCRVSPTNEEVYGDRYVSLQLQPNSLRPQLYMGTVSNPKSHIQEQPIDFVLNKDNDFKVVKSGDGMIKTYINNVEAGSAQYSFEDYPPLEKLMVYVSDSFHEPANAFVRQLKYTPVFTTTTTYKFLHSPLTVQRNNLLGIIEYPSQTYSISCAIRPNGANSDWKKKYDWTSIFRFSKVSATDVDFYGDRSPALLFQPGTGKLLLAQGSTTNPNHHIDVTTTLNHYQDNTVKIISSEDDRITIYVNGVESGSVYIPLEKRPNIEKLLVYVGDPYYQSANAQVSNLVYKPIIAEDPIVTTTTFAPSAITISKNNKVGQVLNPSSQYVISSTITPLGTVDGWGCLFRFTKDPGSNAENYGDRNPLLMFHSGNYDLHSSVMFAGEKNYKNMYNMKGIISNQDNDVKIVAIGNEISYYVNNERVGSMLTPIDDRPQIDLLHVYASDNFYDAANAQVTNLVFTPISSDTPIPFYPGEIAITKNKKVGDILTPSSNFKINFSIQPSGIKSGLSSILRFGRTSYKDKEFYGDRVPAFFFSPGTLKLVVAQGSTRDSSHEMLSSSALDINKHNTVELVNFEDTVTLYVNDMKEGSMIVPLANRPLLEELQVHAGDEYYDEANAILKDLVYTPLESTKTNEYSSIDFLPSTMKLVQGKKYGDIYNSNSQYIISFNIKPLGIVSGWTNILRFTTDPSDNIGTYGARSPALFFHNDNSIDLQLSQLTNAGHVAINNIKGLVLNEETHVKVVALGHLIKVYFDDIKVGEMYSNLSSRPPVDHLQVVSASIDTVANAEISNLVYTPIPDIITDPFYPVEQGYCLNTYGGDQSSGVTDLGDLKTATWDQQQQECKEKCIVELNRMFLGVAVTGCEASKVHKKCFAHNQPVARGSGDTNHVCWVTGAPVPFKYERGRCVESNGSHASSIYHRTQLSGLTNNDYHCMRKCIEYYDQSTEKENISACQRDYSDSKCYVYHLSSYVAVRGDGNSNFMCIMKDNFQCSGDKCDCGTSSILQEDYRGTISRTQSGLPCQRWDTQSPHRHSYNPKSYGLDGNYCRNPGRGKIRPWCYTQDPRKQWDYCDVPRCPCGTLSKKKDDYRGDIVTTTSGRTCQAWNSQTVHTHDRTSPNYPTAGLESNFCRNPGSKSTPWCYTTDPNVPFDACNVPTCDPIMKVRVYVDTLYNICDADGWRDQSDAYINVYVNGRYCGRTRTHWDRNPTYFRQYFYCGTHNMYTSLRVYFNAYDEDGRYDDYLGGTRSYYNSEIDHKGWAYFSGGRCGSGMRLNYATNLYL